MLKKSLIILSLLALILTPRIIAGIHNKNIAADAARKGDFALAAEAYEKAANQLFWQNSLWNEAARAYLIAGQRDEARRAYRKALQENALSAFGWDYLGLDAQAQGNEAEALQFWQDGLKKFPDYLPFYTHLASLYQAKGDYPNEIAMRREYLARDSESEDAAYMHYRLGVLLLPDSQEEALDELTLAARVDPTFASAVDTLRTALNLALLESDPAEKRILLGRGLALVGEWELAAQIFTEATQAYPKSASAWAWLGEAKQHLGEDPLPALDRALSLNPQSVLTRSLRGLYWQRQGDATQAAKEFHAAAALEPKNPQWQAALGESYAQNGDLQLALAAYQKAVELAPQDPRYWQFLARFSVQYAVQPEEIGLPAAQKAVELAPQDPAAADTLGWVYLGMENDAEAEKYFKAALALDANWSAAYLHLGMLYLKEGHGELAKAALLQAQALADDPAVFNEAARLLNEYFQE